MNFTGRTLSACLAITMFGSAAFAEAAGNEAGSKQCYATFDTKAKILQIRGESSDKGKFLPCVKGTTLVIGPTFSKPLNTAIAESFCDMKLPVNARAYSEDVEAVYCTYSGQNNNAKVIYGWPVEVIK